MIEIDRYIIENKLEEDVFALLQVHDELVYEIRDAVAEKVAGDITKIMESVMSPKDTKGVILKAEAAIGGNWGELK
jgi:DNA polymerase-1